MPSVGECRCAPRHRFSRAGTNRGAGNQARSSGGANEREQRSRREGAGHTSGEIVAVAINSVLARNRQAASGGGAKRLRGNSLSVYWNRAKRRDRRRLALRFA